MAVSVILKGLSWLYPAVPVLLLVGIIAAGRGMITGDFLRVLILMLPFGIWATLTSLWSFYPLVSLTRGLYYLFLVTGLTALVYHLKQHRINVFELLLPVNVLMVFTSLISLLSGMPSDGWTAGNAKGFMGLFAHQNSLGAILLFTFPGWLFLHWLMENKKASENPRKISFLFWYAYPVSIKYFLLAGVFLNFLLLTLTYSRASILSFFVMLVLYVFLIYRRNVKSLAVSSVLLFVVFLSLSLIDPVSLKDKFLGSSKKDAAKIQKEKILPKHVNKNWYSFWYKGNDSPYSTRQHIFSDSWKAAQLGGLIGIGYGISHPDIKNNAAGSRFDENGRYIREKGNSFLALIEETGIIGLFLILLPLVLLILMNIQFQRNVILLQPKPIFLSVILTYYFHSQFEAWVISVTSIFLVFLTIFLVSVLSRQVTDNFKFISRTDH